MSLDEFRLMIEVRQDFDFLYKGKRYSVRLDKANKKIFFGEEFTQAKVFDSFTHLMAEAKIGTRLLNSLLVDIS